MTIFFSLLHATWHSEAGPLRIRDEWLKRSAFPENIEYIFALDSDDAVSLKETEGFLRTVGRPSQLSTAIRNWNEAAKLASGQVFVLVADDLLPETRWDEKIIVGLSGIDPLVEDFVIKVSEAKNQPDHFLRHPIISRAYYEKFGLFDSDYSHLFADTDFSLRAFKNSIILDLREVHFAHSHPSDGAAKTSLSQTIGNRSSEKKFGRQTFVSKWSFWDRARGVGIIAPATYRRFRCSPILVRLFIQASALKGSARKLRREVRHSLIEAKLWPTSRLVRRLIRTLRRTTYPKR